MTFREMVPWRWGGLRQWRGDDERPIGGFEEQVASLHRDMDRLFEDMWAGSGRHGLLAGRRDIGGFLPQVDEREDEAAYHVAVDLPGMDEKDVEVTVSDRTLTIRGEKKDEDEEKRKDFYRRERSYGSFRRVLQLPVGVDPSRIEASFDKGVLNVTLPKTEEAQARTRRIPVKAA